MKCFIFCFGSFVLGTILSGLVTKQLFKREIENYEVQIVDGGLTVYHKNSPFGLQFYAREENFVVVKDDVYVGIQSFNQGDVKVHYSITRDGEDLLLEDKNLDGVWD